jgi:hypothetical protein
MKAWEASHWSGKEGDHVALAHPRILRTFLHKCLISLIATEFSAVPLFCEWIVFYVGLVIRLELKAS